MKDFMVIAAGFENQVVKMVFDRPTAVNVVKALGTKVMVVIERHDGEDVACFEAAEFLKVSHVVPVCQITGKPYVCESCGEEQGHFEERCNCK